MSDRRNTDRPRGDDRLTGESFAHARQCASGGTSEVTERAAEPGALEGAPDGIRTPNLLIPRHRRSQSPVNLVHSNPRAATAAR